MPNSLVQQSIQWPEAVLWASTVIGLALFITAGLFLFF